MRPFHVLMILVLVAGYALAASDEPQVTRILYLDGTDTRTAVTLLRSEVQVRQIAELRDLDLVVVKGTRERVDRSERLLRDRGAIARVVEPHDPEPPESTQTGPNETRVFRLRGIERKAAIVILRAIYQIREIEELPDERDVSVTAPTAKLDRAGALLKALDVLALPAS